MIVLELIMEKNAIRNLASRFRPVMLRRMKQSLILLEGSIKTSARDLLKNAASKGYQGRTTGLLRNSWTHEGPEIHGEYLEGKVGSNAPYARIHEEGGVITPRTKQALTVPFPGPNYGSAKALRQEGRTIVIDDIIYLKQHKGRDRGRLIPIFALRRSVVVPARHYITEGINRATPRIKELFTEGVEVELTEE